MKHLAVLLPALALAVTLTLFAGRSLTPDTPLDAETSPAAPVIDPTGAGAPTPAQLAGGARVYRALCAACHLPDGRGMAGVIPPLGAADYLLEDRARAIRVVLHGLSGPITVNGAAYNGVMPPLGPVLTDRQAADVLTYVFNSWGNAGDAFAAGHVAHVRAGGN